MATRSYKGRCSLADRSHHPHIRLVNATCSACSPLLAIERRACFSKHNSLMPHETMRSSLRVGLLFSSTINNRRTAPSRSGSGYSFAKPISSEAREGTAASDAAQARCEHHRRHVEAPRGGSDPSGTSGHRHRSDRLELATRRQGRAFSRRPLSREENIDEALSEVAEDAINPAAAA